MYPCPRSDDRTTSTVSSFGKGKPTRFTGSSPELKGTSGKTTVVRSTRGSGGTWTSRGPE